MPYNINAGYGAVVAHAVPIGSGKVFYVAQAGTSVLEFLQRIFPTDSDGVDRVYAATAATSHTAIQAALDACVSGRNDYVIILPSSSDYDLTATLTMSRDNVHLICLAGMRIGGIGANNAAVLDQNTADTAVITLTGNNCEIAGFKFANTEAATLLATTGHICVPTANTGHAVEIHHNTFEITASGSDNEPFINFYNGGSGNRCDIHHNVFRIPTPATTMAYGCYLSSAYANFAYNDMIVQNGATITNGVRMNGSGGMIKYNNFVASRAGGGLSAGAFGAAILIDTNDQTAAIGNRGAVGTGTMIQGGTADSAFCDNRSGVNGGVLCVDQDIDA